jgi:hypothetical protein
MPFIHLKPGFACHLQDVHFLFAPIDSGLDSLTHSLEDFVCLGVGPEENFIHGHLHTSSHERLKRKAGRERWTLDRRCHDAKHHKLWRWAGASMSQIPKSGGER